MFNVLKGRHNRDNAFKFSFIVLFRTAVPKPPKTTVSKTFAGQCPGVEGTSNNDVASSTVPAGRAGEKSDCFYK